ncbi:alpha/beta fold hydrolase [Zobellia russellii]|uniref:hypothetical protein n=1 Tax=Zobellia russellii TaxID=248907 RepID=UPI001BFFB09A|nr:hypothetical protein [Zobellia russellii]MBT9187967.1 hypothetical protein [Zobellia russellii]
MAERLVIISDMWGAKKGLWITSYLGYLQQHFNITFYDCQQLGNIDVKVNSEENIHQAFVNGGIETAVAHLLKKEKEPAHYLCFSIGGAIAWKAALSGLPMKSLYAVSSTRVRSEVEKPEVPMRLLFGDADVYRPKASWYKEVGVEGELVKGFSHNMYTDEKIIKKVCLDLLNTATQVSGKTNKQKVI